MSATSGRSIGLHAGSAMPADSVEVDMLLRRVPDVAFVPELEGSVFSSESLGAVSPFVARAQITKLATPDYLVGLRAGLDALLARARAEKNGGLEFLATTLGHFVDEMPPDQHPLLVALWCRAWARRRGRDEVPQAVAVAMDEYESM